MNEHLFFILFIFVLWLGFYSVPKGINDLHKYREQERKRKEKEKLKNEKKS